MENTNITPTTFDNTFATFILGLIIERLTPAISAMVKHELAHASIQNHPALGPLSDQILASSAFADAVTAQVEAALEAKGEEATSTDLFERKVKKLVLRSARGGRGGGGCGRSGVPAGHVG